MKNISKNNDGEKIVLLETIIKTKINEARKRKSEYPYKDLEIITSHSAGSIIRYIIIIHIVMHRSIVIKLKDLLSIEYPLK